jgi:hypothetical protein
MDVAVVQFSLLFRKCSCWKYAVKKEEEKMDFAPRPIILCLRPILSHTMDSKF